MTTEYHDNAEEENSFWSKDPAPVYFSGVSRFRGWLVPGVTAAVVLALIIALGASNTNMLSRLWSVEKSVSNMTESLNTAQQQTTEAARDTQRLKFAVESNKDQLTSVSEALKQLSDLDTISRSVATLRCSLERFIKNATVVEGCCPLGWETFSHSCYLFSKTSLAWHEAKDWCNGHESHLAILHTDEEWDYVVSNLRGTFHWVGLSDERTGKWEWVNETPYIMNRRRWMPGQPDSWTHHGLGPGDEDCAHLHREGRLNDLHCSTRLHYICQKHSQRI